MKFEVLLSVLNLDRNELKRQNITSNCIVINQCLEEKYEENNNFKIYSVKEKGVSNSRNKALDYATGDILLFADDDVIYNHNYENIIKSEFIKHPEADMIFFNLISGNSNRRVKINNKFRRVRFCNCLRYGTCRIAVRSKFIKEHHLSFNPLFGGNSKYSCGEDSLFIVSCLNNKLKIYSSSYVIGTVEQKKSTWFKGYTEKYFFDKGALFCAIKKSIYRLLNIQYLLRNKGVLTDISFKKALSLMNNGSRCYLKGEDYNDFSSSNSL